MNYIVCGYYTLNTDYEDMAKDLIKTLETWNLDYDIRAIQNRGSWYTNMQYKPTFIRQIMEEYPDKNVVYLDCDAEVIQDPKLFHYLTCDIAVHVLDHSKYARKNHKPEMLSGTIFFRNTEGNRTLVDEWIRICRQNDRMWDQVALVKAIGTKPFHNLPEEYCVIFDYMRTVESPVIVHYQASRKFRRQNGRVTTRKV